MIVEAQVIVTLTALTPPAHFSVNRISYLDRVWPPTAIAVGLIATAAWISSIAYGLFELLELAF